MKDEPPLVLYRQIGKAVASSTERLEVRVRAENDQRFAAVDERISKLEALVDLSDRQRYLRDHELHDVAYEAMTTGDDEPLYGWGRERGLTRPQTKAIAEEYLRAAGF